MTRRPVLTPDGTRAVRRAGVAIVATAVASNMWGIGGMGLSPAAVPRGLKWGAVSAIGPLTALVVAGTVPAIRSRLGSSHVEPDVAEWLVVRIPLGTVVAEELLFRSLLPAVTRRFGLRLQTGLCATAFGLWHIRSARAAGDNVPVVVAFTAASGVLFHVLRLGSGSVLAPAILHLTVNVGGAALVVAAAQR